jgi:hypothetical protein
MKSAIERALFFFAIALVFYVLYLIEYNKTNPGDLNNHVEAIYNSFMIQTLVGVPEPPLNQKVKLLQTVQSIIGYLLITGFIVYVVHIYKK